MRSIPKDFFSGARATVPILLGVVPFALITGVAAVTVGLGVSEAVGMSFIVFAGASQLAVLQLLGTGSPFIIMVLTAWVINLRFTMYSAALAPYLQRLPVRFRAPLAYMLSDQAFGVTMSRFSVDEPQQPGWFYFGSALTVWTTWQISAISGSLLGALVPESWGFDFAFPLSFMALMFGALRDRPAVVAALVGGMTAVLAKELPYNLGLVLAALLGIISGLVAEQIVSQRSAEA